MKPASRFLSLFLVPVLMFSSSVCASGTAAAPGEELSAGADSTTGLFVSLTERTSKSLVFIMLKLLS
jgi:hypothetical protein